MISFSAFDILIVIGFLISIVLIGLIAARGNKNNHDEYLLSGRKVGLLLFVLTNVATWYGGILGVGEFSYRYGLVSWLTQGLPYYLFALLFAFFFADKIKRASLFTIPDKLYEIYGSKVSLISALFIFILVSPAPYLLIMGQIISIVFSINYLAALIVAAFASSIYLIKGGYKSNISTDAFSFVIMFIGFIIIVIAGFSNYGGYEFLASSLPPEHLKATGGKSGAFITVWFLIALWTFADPGFHQRCYSAKSGEIAKKGIVISILFWIFFDFLTNTTGLYARAILPGIDNPVLSFPLLADKILGPGLKGLFFASLIATVISTLNSFIFLSATTFSRDFVFRIYGSKISITKSPIKNRMLKLKYIFVKEEAPEERSEIDLVLYTKIGVVIAVLISIIISYYFESVVQIWYTLGSICIPGIILLVISSYYEKLRIKKSTAFLETLVGFSFSLFWLIAKDYLFTNDILLQIEPMIVGLFFASAVHIFGMINYQNT